MRYRDSNFFGRTRLPFVAVLLAVVMVIPEMLIFLGDFWPGTLPGSGAGLRGFTVTTFGFWPGLIEMRFEQGSLGLEEALRFMTYPLVHLSAVDAAFSVVFVLVAFRIITGIAHETFYLATFFGSSALGALAYYFLAASDYPLAGASPGFLGLFGLAAAATVMSGKAGRGQPLDIGERTILILPVLLIGFELVSSMLFGGRGQWVADLTGFLAGFLVAPLVFEVPYSRLLGGLLRLLR